MCLLSVVILSSSTAFLSGCAGLVSGANSTGTLPSTLDITNVQTGSITASSSQVVWTTNAPANSSVDFGTTTAYGNSTPIDSAMVTNHQMTLSGLAAGTTYYYQVNSTDSKNNHGKSGGHTLKTTGFNIAGTITPATGGSGTTLTLSGAASSATTTADGSGNYTFVGLANGTYTIAPSHAGFTFSPSSQSMTINGANVTGVNFTDTAVSTAPTISAQPVNQTVTAGQTATFTVVAGGTAPLSYQWQKSGVNIAGATGASYTTPATTIGDSGSTFRVVVSNTAGTLTSAAATLTVNAASVPGIQLSSSSLSYGNVVDGGNSSQALIITNTGTATLTITQVNETGSAFGVSGYSLPLNVVAGQQTTITVAFQPTAVGAASGNISIVSNAPSSPTPVSMSGTGVAATLTLSINPASLSFGNITTSSSSASQNATITNIGNSNVAISQITLTGAGYSMTGGGAPVTLTPTQKLTLTVQFSPTAAGSVNGSISIVSNASGSPATISLSGTGVVPVQHSAALTWNASSSTVSGYNVYRSAVSGSSYTKINSSLVATLTYTDANVQSGTTYYYVTTAVDSSGNESDYSNEVVAAIP
jgi:Abnormal spindle-like microcephaly-assoc'd, ASPM-SPD-2-Hydin/Protein of unknown function (DUF1573)